MGTEKGSALQKGLTILETLAESSEGQSAQELADVLGLHKTNVYRYLKTLEEAGYIRRDDAARFHLGYRVLELGAHLLQRMPLRETAHACLVQLGRSTSQTVHLSILHDHEIVYVDKIEGYDTLPMRSRVGSRALAHCTASGKMLLSLLPESELDRILVELEFVPRTRSTITRRDEFICELKHTAKRGYAVDRAENEEHIFCFAAPILDQSGRALAAVSLTGLASDFDDPAAERRLLDELLAATGRLSEERGYVRIETVTSTAT